MHSCWSIRSVPTETRTFVCQYIRIHSVLLAFTLCRAASLSWYSLLCMVRSVLYLRYDVAVAVVFVVFFLFFFFFSSLFFCSALLPIYTLYTFFLFFETCSFKLVFKWFPSRAMVYFKFTKKLFKSKCRCPNARVKEEKSIEW